MPPKKKKNRNNINNNIGNVINNNLNNIIDNVVNNNLNNNNYENIDPNELDYSVMEDGLKEMNEFEILDDYDEAQDLKDLGDNVNVRHHANLNARVRQRAAEHRAKSEEDRQALRRKEDYVLKETTEAEDETYTKNFAQIEHGIQKSNRQIAKEVFGSEVYDDIDEARKGSEKDRTVKIHHSVGNKQLEAGEPVLEIDIAGSGFSHPWREHHGNSSWSSGSRNEGEHDPEYADFLDKEYGKRIDGKDHVREKKSHVDLPDGTRVEKSRISIAGPDGLNSSRDDYNINKTRDYSVEKVKAFLKEHLDRYVVESAGNPLKPLKDIHINLAGHSRGAVAAAETVRQAYDWLVSRKEYDFVRKYVKFNLDLRDPVPGFGDQNAHPGVDLSDVKGLNSTVVYSMSQQHYDWTFAPMPVTGTDRLIFGVLSHNAALDNADFSQMGVDGDGEIHKTGFFDPATGEYYRSSGISELPKGVYFTDEKLNLIRVDNFSQIDRLAQVAFEGNDGLQVRRLNTLKKAALHWFATHDITYSYKSEEEYEQLHENLEHTKSTVLRSKNRKTELIRTALEQMEHIEAELWDDPEKQDEYMNAQKLVRDRCKAYMRSVKLPIADPEENKELNFISHLLTGVQREYNYLKNGLDVKPEKEKEGKAERQLAREEKRIGKVGRLKSEVLGIASEALELLEKLEKTKKFGTNSGTYDRLHDALKEVSELNGRSTITKVEDSLKKLSEAGKAYEEAHSGILKGNIGDGRVRYNLSKDARSLGDKSLNSIKKITVEMPNKKTKIDDLLERQGKTVGRSLEKVQSEKRRKLEKEELKNMMKAERKPDHAPKAKDEPRKSVAASSKRPNIL